MFYFCKLNFNLKSKKKLIFFFQVFGLCHYIHEKEKKINYSKLKQTSTYNTVTFSV